MPCPIGPLSLPKLLYGKKVCILLHHPTNTNCFVFVCSQVTEENVYSVLCFADVYLLTGLKRLCARVISTFLDPENVFTVLRTARLFDLPRLEVDCCEYIGKNLEKVRT